MENRKEVSIREARENIGLSIEEAAIGVGIDPNKIIEHEANPFDVPVSLAIRMASLYKVSINQLSFT